MTSEEHLQNFLGAASRNLERECSAVVSSIAWFKTDVDAYINLATQVTLSPPIFADISEKPIAVDVGQMKAYRVVVKHPNVMKVLEVIVGGLLPNEIMPTGWNHNVLFEGNPYWAFHALSSWVGSVEGYSFDSLGARGRSLHELLPSDQFETIGRCLPTLSHPFRDFSELARAIGINHDLDLSESASVRFLSPEWVKIDEIHVDIPAGRMCVKLHSLWEDCGGKPSISIIPVQPRGADTRAIYAIDDSWQHELIGAKHVFERSFNFPLDSGPLEVHLNIGDRWIERKLAGTGSTKLIAYCQFDPDFSILRKILYEKKGSSCFEQAVQTLLGLCGFATAYTGAKEYGPSPDLLAFAGQNQILFIECSTENPSEKKVSLLHQRATQYQMTILGRGNTDVVVCCVMVLRTNVFTATMPMEILKAAEKQHVRIVGRETLETLINELSQDVSVSERFMRLSGMQST